VLRKLCLALGRAAAIDTDSPVHRAERAEQRDRVWRAIRRTRPGR
jgi:hypothetical protein